MARTKGAVAKGVDNKIVRDYLLAHGPLRNQKQVVDDSIRGAKGQEEESHRYSNERLFAMLTRLDYIDTKTVLTQMHAYNLAKGNEDIPSLRNVQRITRVLRCASQAIQYHAKKWHKNECDIQITNVPVFELSDDEREKLRLWADEGQWDKVIALLKSSKVITQTYELPTMKDCANNQLRLESVKRSLQPLNQLVDDVGERYTVYKCAA
ncbi:hypothetical protein ACOVH1_002547 [Klebsiella pneumoniae]|uniref:hypothetical protein n=1 Tax=Klebsiella pneumoniae TaxID=573 RepID=UPI0018881DCC|nr:hypothetical protein [Klebsiella pneumoniae]MDZ1604511.1 hypothetical protein [Klebsiella pneumoniae]HDH7833650.1 hypothetical protein [Raoultella ornithinolytica]